MHLNVHRLYRHYALAHLLYYLARWLHAHQFFSLHLHCALAHYPPKIKPVPVRGRIQHLPYRNSRPGINFRVKIMPHKNVRWSRPENVLLELRLHLCRKLAGKNVRAKNPPVFNARCAKLHGLFCAPCNYIISRTYLPVGFMLYLIGMGICDEKDISLRALDALKKCDFVFAESYTSILSEGALLRLEALCGKKIALLQRANVEGEKEIVDACKNGSAVCLLVAGDPLIATTHVSLLLAAQKKGIATKVLHASSILSAAIGESGLQAYRFGKIVTIPKWKEHYKPSSPYDTIEENLSRNLHTLLLLDLDENGAHLEPKEALRELLEMEEEKKKGIISPATNLLLLSPVFWPSQKRIYSSLAALLDGHTDDLPAILILPAKLHFMEE